MPATVKIALSIAATLLIATSHAAATPVLRYSTYWGGSDRESTGPVYMAVDGAGNTYVMATTFSANFPIRNPLYPTPATTPYDFLAKLSANGQVVYSTFLPGAGRALAVDGAGNVYVGGWAGASGVRTVNAAQPTYGGGSQDGFVTKLSPTGQTVFYATYLGGSGHDFLTDIAVDAGGNLYALGTTDSPDFPLVNASLSPGGGFLARFSPSGALVYSTTHAYPTNALAMDAAGGAYLAGSASCDLQTQNAAQPTCGGGDPQFCPRSDGALAKIAADGTVAYATFLGGSACDHITDVSVDSSGRPHVLGTTASLDFPVVNAWQPAPAGGREAFVARLSADGTQLQYSTYLGGTGNESSAGMAVDGSGHAYVTGFAQRDFPAINAIQATNRGFDDVFIAKLSPAGVPVFSSLLGSTSSDMGRAVGLAPGGDFIVGGFASGPGFPTTTGAAQPAHGGGYDLVISKIGEPPTPTPTPTPPSNGMPRGTISAPPPGTLYKGGDLIAFAGDCADAEDGTIPASGFFWNVVFHHDTHTHPGVQFPGVKGGSFTTPVDGEWDPNQWWRITLVCRDSSGQTAPTVRDVFPQKRTLTLTSSPSGLQVAADGVTGPAPQSMEAVAGMKRILDTNAPQTLAGTTYYFQKWSDGGAKRHDVFMPDGPASFTATFRPASEYSEQTPGGAAVTTSTSDSNVGANAVDNNLATRWSGNGDGAWLKLDLGSTKTVGHVGMAVYQGNLRRNRFDIQVSTDNTAWVTAFSGESSGTTTNEELYDFADVAARWVRYVGHGNVGSANPSMNSVTEVSVYGVSSDPTPTSTPTPPTPTPTATPTQPARDVEITPAGGAVTASTSDSNVPANTVDKSLATRWSGNGDGAWIQYDLGIAKTVSFVKVAVYNGNTRRNRFDLQYLNSSGVWTNLVAGAQNSGTTTNLETFEFADVSARHVRYLGHMSNVGTFNSVTEVEIWQSGGVTPTPTATPTPITPTPTPPASSCGTEITPSVACPEVCIAASVHDGNVPANAIDNNLNTRWSANGDGQWLRLDLGSPRPVCAVSVAAYNGNMRQNIFDIQLSNDGFTWSNVLTGARTSGTTSQEEMFDVADGTARFIRYLGHMNTVNTFNSVSEISIFGGSGVPANMVVMGGMTYTPETLSVSPGTTITWVNQSSVSHTATSDAGDWDSGMLGPWARFSRLFDTVGSHPYHCGVHPGMTGTVVVSP